MTTRRRVVIDAAQGRRPRPQVQRFRVRVEEDLDADVSYLMQEGLAERRAAHKRGEFSHVGVRVEAEVLIEGTVQVLTSPGVWGVESDSVGEDLAAVCAEEYRALRDVLKAVGVSTSELPQEVEQSWYEDADEYR